MGSNELELLAHTASGKNKHNQVENPASTGKLQHFIIGHFHHFVSRYLGESHLNEVTFPLLKMSIFLIIDLGGAALV